MAQLKEIRNRIGSVKNTRQVTSAMKLVSAAKLKKAQDAIMQIVPYDKKLHEILQNLSMGEINLSSPYFSTPEIENVLILVVGANRGLCGAFNTNVGKKAIQHAYEKYETLLKGGRVKFLPIGRQVEKYLRIKKLSLYDEANALLENHNYEETSAFASGLMKLFAEGNFQRIDIIYNKFKNAALQELTTEQFLPVQKPGKDEVGDALPDYIFEPGQEEILNSLIPKALRMRVYRILLDSNAAEHGARMTAMHQATDNASDLLLELRKTYNNARQAAITSEILEITAGAEALKGK